MRSPILLWTLLWLIAAATTPRTACAEVTTSPQRILFLTKLKGPDKDVDQIIKNHLEQLGYTVSLVNENARPADATHDDLVIISSTVSGKNIDPSWRSAPVNLLTWENDILDDLAMSGKRHDVDFGETPKERYLWIVNAPHSMSGNLKAGLANVYQRQAAMSWGKPGLGATIIATVYGQPEKVAIFGYEKGATMDYESIAPARRVMLFLDNNTFANLSSDGFKLFDASVRWAIQKNNTNHYCDRKI